MSGWTACAARGALLVLALSPVGRGWAGTQEGVAAYHRGDYSTALSELSAPAHQGDPEAQLYLGLMYYRGQGVVRDDREAAAWFRRAADEGDAHAQFNLGLLYARGEGMPRSDAEAARWLRSAAEQGHAPAQASLAYLYARGRGVRQDSVQAHLWYTLAASGLPPGSDRDQAARNRDIVARGMTRAQIAEAQRLEREWKPR